MRGVCLVSRKGTSQRNAALVGRASADGRTQGTAPPSQLALAWLLAKGHDIVPIPGTKRRRYLDENVAAADIALSASTTSPISKRCSRLTRRPGERYPAEMERLVDRG